MTVSSQTSKETYNGNGVTTTWDLPFRFFDNDDIFAYQVDPVALVTTPLTLGIDYSLYGAGLPEQFGTAPGKITTTVPIPNGKQLYVERIMAIEQLTDIVNQGRFFPEVHEDVFDNLTMLIQQSDASNKGAIRVAFTDPEPNRLPPARARANLLMGFDSAGNPIAVAPVSGSTSDLALMLANNVNSFQGAAMIGYRGRNVRSKLDDSLTVEDFGAVGDGIADDKPAFLSMAAATGGIIRMTNKAYNVNGLNLEGASIRLIGAGKPVTNSNYTQMNGGSVLVGSISIRSNSVVVQDFGLDAGSARGVTAVDGLVINAGTGQVGFKCIAKNLNLLGTSEVSTTHALLVQGFYNNEIENIDCSIHNFGVVCKGQNGYIRGIIGYRTNVATVYVKSDTPDVGGGVADASASYIVVDDVLSTANPTNTQCNAVYVQASTLPLSNVTVSKVIALYGNAGLRIAGGSDPSIATSQVQFSNITSLKSVRGVELFGYNFETVGNGVIATNPSSGEAVSTSGNSINYNLNGLEVLIADAAIVATSAASFYGTGTWDNFTVRNPYRTMIINMLINTVTSGIIGGDVRCAVEGNLALVNSWGSSGGHAPRLIMGPKNCIHMTGWAAPAVATGDQIATLPFSMADEKFFSCVARKTDASYTIVPVYVAGTSITLLTVARSTLTYIDLSGITFYLR